MERYDPGTDSWSLVANLSVGRDAIGVCVLGQKLFAVGGYDGTGYLSLVEAYDSRDNTWREVGYQYSYTYFTEWISTYCFII